MFTIENNIKNELIVNKSRFITYVYKVNTIQMVNEYISLLKREYKDATHYCYAYKIDNIKRFNDDKEPTHTAGMPILNVIESKNLNNILIVVIRYFGGIKLGTGGLVRAYSNSASTALDNTNIIEDIKVFTKKIMFSYENINIINYILNDYKITYKEFDQMITYEFLYNENNYPKEIDKYIKK